MNEDLENKVRQAAENGRLPCAKAFKIAEEEGLSPAEIGKIANRLDIKIVNCQLGCF